MYCRNCGKQIDDKAVVCVGCGVPPLRGVTYCQSCGKETAGATDVCPSCGVKLAQATAIGGDDKTWAMLAHVLLVTWFIGPLVVLLTKGKESAVVEDQAKEALNFCITVSALQIALQVVGGILTAVLFPITAGLAVALAPLFMFLAFAVGIGALIMVVMAIVQVNNGNMNYRYPVCLRLIK